MTARVFWSIAFVAALIGTAAGEPKTKIGVLGLEVVGTIDTQATTTAKNLTESLRAQVRSSAKYALAPNSNKDLPDEKVNQGCDTEAQDCMSKIAKRLGAQVLVYGKIEYKPNNGADGYWLSIKLLDTDKATVKTEKVFISLQNVADGSKGLDPKAVEAFDKITESGSTTTVVPIDPNAKGKDDKLPPPAKKPGAGWRITAYATGAAALVATGAHVYAWRQLSGSDVAGGDNCIIVDGTSPDDNNIDDTKTRAAGGDPGKCRNAPRNRTITRVAGPMAIGLGVVAIIATYKGFIAAKESSSPTAGRSTRKRSRFAVTPVVTPDGAGATVQIDW